MPEYDPDYFDFVGNGLVVGEARSGQWNNPTAAEKKAYQAKITNNPIGFAIKDGKDSAKKRVRK